MRVWPMACEPFRAANLSRLAILLGSPTPLKISIDCPWLSTVASGTLSISHFRAASPSPLVLKIAWSSISSTVTLAPTALASRLAICGQATLPSGATTQILVMPAVSPP